MASATTAKMTIISEHYALVVTLKGEKRREQKEGGERIGVGSGAARGRGCCVSGPKKSWGRGESERRKLRPLSLGLRE